MQDFFKELKKRKVIKVAVVYLVVAWVLMQIVDVMFPALDLPEWTISLAQRIATRVRN
jgi:adenylate cyclase